MNDDRRSEESKDRLSDSEREVLIGELGRLIDETAPETPPAREDFRRELRELTSARVRILAGRSNGRRVLARAAAAVLLYAGGFATNALLSSSGEDSSSPTPVAAPPSIETSSAPADEPLLAVEEASTESTSALLGDLPPDLDGPTLSARIRRVLSSERERALRRAGDEYLSPERSDPESALLCYSKLLDRMDPGEAVETNPGDPWLLTYLKLARRE